MPPGEPVPFGSLFALGGRATGQHQRADGLVVPLLGPGAQELDLLPLFRRLDAVPAPVPASLRHPAGTPEAAAGSEACYKRGFAASPGSPAAWVPLSVAHFVARFAEVAADRSRTRRQKARSIGVEICAAPH